MSVDETRHLRRATEERNRRRTARIGVFVAGALGIALGIFRAYQDPTAPGRFMMVFVWPIVFAAIWLAFIWIRDQKANRHRWEIETEEATLKQDATQKRIEEAKASGAFDKWDQT